MSPVMSNEMCKKVLLTLAHLALFLLTVFQMGHQMITLTSGLHSQGYVTEHQMERCPDNMERWGMAEILNDAGGLSYRHLPLFLPFTLALYFPTSLVVSFHTIDDDLQLAKKHRELQNQAFLGPAPKDSTASQHGDPGTQMMQQPGTRIAKYRSMLVMVIGLRFALVALSYILELWCNVHLGQGGDCVEFQGEPNTRRWQTLVIIWVKRVFGFLPFALYRMVLTDLWLFFFKIATAIALTGLVVILTSILVRILVVMGYSPDTGSTWVAFLMPLPFGVIYFNHENLLSCEYLFIMYAPGDVLREPDKFCRRVMEKSFKFIKGHWGIFLCYLLVTAALLPAVARWFEAALLVIDSYCLPLWGWMVCRALLNILRSDTGAYGMRDYVSLRCNSSANQVLRTSCTPS